MQPSMIKKFKEKDAELARHNASMLGSLVVSGHFDTAEELIANGFRFDELMNTVFLLSASQNKMEAVSFLLRHGLDANHQNTANQSGLHMCGTGDMTRTLLRAGAQVNARDRDGNTPLHLAFQDDKARVLIEHGADLSAQNNQQMTPERFLWFWAKSQQGGDGYERVANATRIQKERDALLVAVQGSLAQKSTSTRRAM